MIKSDLFPRFVYMANYYDYPGGPYNEPRYFKTKRLACAAFGKKNVVRYRRDDGKPTRASKRKRRSGK